jgi:Zn-dependent M28 family amino/carboxypeptidase
MVNLVVTIPGVRKERIVIAGHYDTKLYRQFRFVGASDGGSSAAFLLELARVLKGRKNPMTIELLFLDGEEARLPEWSGTDNTYGSRHYVEMARHDGSLATLKALLLVDMIGDRDLAIRRDTNSTPWLTNVIWETAKRHNLDDYFIAESTRIEDDHLPFLAAGIPSVDIIDLDYEAWHTAKDTLDAVSARSLQVVGDVVLGALPTIEAHVSKTLVLTGRRIGARRPYKLLKANTRLRHHRHPLRRSTITTLTEAH